MKHCSLNVALVVWKRSREKEILLDLLERTLDLGNLELHVVERLLLEEPGSAPGLLEG